MSKDSLNTTSPKAMRAKIQLKTVDLKYKTNADTSETQERYINDYDRRVWADPVFKPKPYVFVDNLLLRSITDSNSEAVSNQPYKVLQQLSSESFRIVMARQKIRTINEHRIPQT